MKKALRKADETKPYKELTPGYVRRVDTLYDSIQVTSYEDKPPVDLFLQLKGVR